MSDRKWVLALLGGATTYALIGAAAILIASR